MLKRAVTDQQADQIAFLPRARTLPPRQAPVVVQHQLVARPEVASIDPCALDQVTRLARDATHRMVRRQPKLMPLACAQAQNRLRSRGEKAFGFGGKRLAVDDHREGAADE